MYSVQESKEHLTGIVLHFQLSSAPTGCQYLGSLCEPGLQLWQLRPFYRNSLCGPGNRREDGLLKVAHIADGRKGA